MANTLNLGNGNWGVKKDSLLGYNSENGNFKPLAFNFDRASSATVVNKAGLIETVGSGEPRIDYKDDSKGALLLEPTRSNLIPYSEDFSIVNWSKYGSGTGVAPTVTSNYAISPDGTLNASRVQFDKGSGITGNDMSILNDNVAVTSGITTSKSVYVKSNTSEEYDIVIYGASSASGTNLKKVRVTSQWQRFDVYGTIPSTTTGITIGLREIGVTGLSNTADVSVWGAQLEQGSYATSYIPTQGSAATRSADICNNGGNEQVINSTEGVLYAEISGFSNTDSSPRVFSLSDGGGSNRIICFILNTEFVVNIQKLGQTPIDLRTDLGDVETPLKMSVKYKANDFALWINGFEIASSSSGQTYSVGTLDRINFDSGFGIENFYGNIKDVRVYNTALTDSELAALTK